MGIPKYRGYNGHRGITKNKSNYRSGLEQLVAVLLEKTGIEAKHEQETLKYVVPVATKRYLVDFTLPSHPALVVEVKGRFTSVDRKKMLYIHTQYPNRQVVMIFGKSANTLSKKSKTTYADWCDKNGISWIDINQLKENPECLLYIQKKTDGLLKSPPKKKKKQS